MRKTKILLCAEKCGSWTAKAENTGISRSRRMFWPAIPRLIVLLKIGFTISPGQDGRGS
jgi:hypothetical protein